MTAESDKETSRSTNGFILKFSIAEFGRKIYLPKVVSEAQFVAWAICAREAA